MKLDQSGLDFIKKWEGLRLKIYKDAAGLETIGYGHLVWASERDGFKDGISQEKAESLLSSDTLHAQHVVSNLVKVPLTQKEFNVLVSFVFNEGAGQFRLSSLLRELNKENYLRVPSELKRWVYVGPKIVQGLKNRREEEARLWEERV